MTNSNRGYTSYNRYNVNPSRLRKLRMAAAAMVFGALALTVATPRHAGEVRPGPDHSGPRTDQDWRIKYNQFTPISSYEQNKDLLAALAAHADPDGLHVSPSIVVVSTDGGQNWEQVQLDQANQFDK